MNTSEKIYFSSEENAQSFAEKVSNTDAYVGSARCETSWGQHYVELETSRISDPHTISVYAGIRGGTYEDR